MASEAWPVCCLILSVETPARVALVANPARRLWPEYRAGSNPAAAIRSRRIKDTASPESRLAELGVMWRFEAIAKMSEWRGKKEFVAPTSRSSHPIPDPAVVTRAVEALN
jgi:hypothetical protein